MKIMHPDGSTSPAYDLTSFSDLMMTSCGDDTKREVVFINGGPHIRDKKLVIHKRHQKRKKAKGLL